jgi:hypothetical protein
VSDERRGFTRVMASHDGPPNPDRPGPASSYYLAVPRGPSRRPGAAAVGKHPMIVHLNRAFQRFRGWSVARTPPSSGKRVTLTILPTEIHRLAPERRNAEAGGLSGLHS